MKKLLAFYGIALFIIMNISPHAAGSDTEKDFISAVKWGHYWRIDSFLEQGVNIDCVDDYFGRNALGVADGERVSGWRWLIDHGADVNLPYSKGGVTPLMDALRHLDESLLSMLVSAGADLYYVTEGGEFVSDYCAHPYQYAHKGHYTLKKNGCWESLIDMGVYIDPKHIELLKPLNIKRPLWLAMMHGGCTSAMVAALPQAKKNVLLRYATIQGDVLFIQMLLAAGAYPLAGDKISILQELLSRIQKYDDHPAEKVQALNAHHKQIFILFANYISRKIVQRPLPDIRALPSDLLYSMLILTHDDSLAKALVGLGKREHNIVGSNKQESCCELM